jgi:hypothetical protein
VLHAFQKGDVEVNLTSSKLGLAGVKLKVIAASVTYVKC